VRADESALQDKPATGTVQDLDSPLARAVEEPERAAPLFPRLKSALQHLPPFFADSEVDFNFRSFYFLDEAFDGAQSEAWTWGGALRLRSGWLRDTAQLGASLFTSQKLVADDPLGRTQLLQPGEKSYTLPAEAYLRLRRGEHELTLFRQELDLPYVNKDDGRMTPNSFEGVVLRGKSIPLRRLGRADYSLGWIARMRPRFEEDFVPMQERAGVPDGDAGLWLLGGQLEPVDELHLGVYEYFVKDTLNTLYVAADYTRPLGDEWALRLQAQLTHQASVGDDRLTGEAFDTFVVGGRVGASFRGLAAWITFSDTDEAESIRNPFGSYAGYLSLMQSDFNRAGERAIGLGLSYDFARVGIEGLSAFLDVAHGDGGFDPLTSADRADEREVDLTVDYRIREGSLRGLWFRARGSVLDRDGEPHRGFELRFVVNYDFTVL
jgi:hypothetical protein